MKTQKFYNRERFTDDEKHKIAKKSNDCCCHCGRKVFFGYGATVDHFIPLDKGGSNSMYNLIMLCHDCNQEKDNKVVPIDYIPYLKDTYKKQLSDYVDSYIKVMDYTQRNRLLAYDEYKIPMSLQTHDYKKHNRNMGQVISHFKIKLATWNDLDKLHEYLVRYLKKYNQLDDEQAARENIIFWMQFGCIYYIEQFNEVTTMFALTIKHVDKDEDFRGIDYIPNLYIFPYYASEKSVSIVNNMITRIPAMILEECSLDFMPFLVIMLEVDKVLPRVSYLFGSSAPDSVNGFRKMAYIVGDVDIENIELTPEDMNESELKTYNFLRKFDDVTDSMISYFRKYADREDISWMINCILSETDIKNCELQKYVIYNEEE